MQQTLSKIIALSLNDFRSIFREQILYVMFVVAPLLEYSVVRWGLPPVVRQYPAVAPYQDVIILLLALQVVGGIGFVLASILLDERDDGVLTALRVTPVGPNTFLFYRLFMGLLVGWVFAIILLRFNGVLAFSWTATVLGGLFFALVAPLVMLAMSSFSKNKVEGLAMFKGINLVLLLPVAAFFLPEAWHYLFWIIPTHWTFQLFAVSQAGGAIGFLLLGAVVVHVLVLVALIRLFRKRVFEAAGNTV